MTKKERVLAYIKDHKKEIIIGACVVVGGVVLYKVGKTKLSSAVPKVEVANFESVNPEHIKIPNFKVGKLDDALRYANGEVELWADCIKLEDMGALGEEIRETISDLPDNAEVWALMSIREKRVMT